MYGQCNTTIANGFSDIISISCSSSHTVGLKSNGTVVAVGANFNGECDTTIENSFSDIIEILVSGSLTFGLKRNGTVVAIGANYYNESDTTLVNGFCDIKKIYAYNAMILGIKENGTIAMHGTLTGSGYFRMLSNPDFIDIVDISVTLDGILGLKSDGKVVSTDSKLYWDWYDEEDTDENRNKFLSYPFNNPQVKIQEGWRFTAPVGPNSNNPYAHLGIDYINGIVNQPETWSGFDVFAAADGVAIKTSGGGYGDFVLIRHDIKNSDGENYFTLYSQLNNIKSSIVEKNRFSTDYNTWTPVNKGDKLGIAGNLPSDNPYDIPLHFEVHAESYAHNKVDPYDIKNTRNYYPGNAQYQGCGDDILWIDDPLDVITDMRDFKVGDIVHVFGTEGVGLRLRSSFTLSSDTRVVMPEGAEVSIIGGYVINDGYDWWEAQYGDEVGWAAGNYLTKDVSREIPKNPDSIGMYTGNDEPIGISSEITESLIKIKASWDSTNSTSCKLQVEVRPVSESYTEPTHSSDYVNGDNVETEIIIRHLDNGKYKWRYRTIDAYSITSEWVDYSNSEFDFSINSIINIDKVTFIPVLPNRDSVDSDIMEGGVAIRHYKLLKPDGRLLKDYIFKYTYNESSEVLKLYQIAKE
jgi:hypothetical protein